MNLDTTTELEVDGYEIELPIHVEFSVYGQYRPSTRLDPEEHPEIEIEKIEIQPRFLELLAQEFEEQHYRIHDELIEKCWEVVNEEAQSKEEEWAEHKRDELKYSQSN